MQMLKCCNALLLMAAGATFVAQGCGITMSMPGESFAGPRPPVSSHFRDLSGALERDVHHLAKTIGERNTAHPEKLAAAAQYIEDEFAQMGFEVARQGYEADGVQCFNLDVTVPGTMRPHEIVIVGAHYDSAVGTPGANDNASGIAALLAIARVFANEQHPRTLRLVAFVNEEPPYFRTPLMGSKVYAKSLHAKGTDIIGMISLETIGYFTEAEDTQNYPFPFSLFYPSVGNFISFVANSESVHFGKKVIEIFRQHGKIPSDGAAAPATIPGIDWSDQQGFWELGYPGVMVTDTAPNRYPYYHEPEDTPDKIDFDALSLVVDGMVPVVRYLLDSQERFPYE